MLKRLFFLLFASLSLHATDHYVLLFFLGPEGCPWSEKFQTEIVQQSDFIDAVRDRLSLEKGEVASDAITTFPTLFLMNAAREKISELPYHPVGSTEYAKYVNEVLDFIASVDEDPDLETLYTRAQALGLKEIEAKLLQKGLQNNKGIFFLLQHYEQVVKSKKHTDPEVKMLRKKILERDPHNRQGIALKVAFLDFGGRKVHFGHRDNPRKVVKPLLDYVEAWGKKDKANLWQVELEIARYFLSKHNHTSARRHAEAARRAVSQVGLLFQEEM